MTKPSEFKVNDDTIVAGKSLRQWDECWVRLPGGLTRPYPDLRHKVGLFRIVASNEVKFLGRATEYSNGGLQKRLADFSRKSPSAREHWAGQRIYEQRHDLIVEILITGEGEAAATAAKQLKTAMLQRGKPPWNCA